MKFYMVHFQLGGKCQIFLWQLKKNYPREKKAFKHYLYNNERRPIQAINLMLIFAQDLKKGKNTFCNKKIRNYCNSYFNFIRWNLQLENSQTRLTVSLKS